MVVYGDQLRCPSTWAEMTPFLLVSQKWMNSRTSGICGNSVRIRSSALVGMSPLR